MENRAIVSAEASLKREKYAGDVPGNGTWAPSPSTRA